MIIKTATFITSAVKSSQYPQAELPEIAFAGRSNVGKSSLINTLVNRKRLVKTGQTPGMTQLINFFDINNTLSFVDLPGYGYAKVPARVKKSWGTMIENYLQTRETLKGVVAIMDIRRTPGQKETELIQWLAHYRIPSIKVLTKADKLKKTKQRIQHDLIATLLGTQKEDLILFSAKSRLGKDKLWEAVNKLIAV